jgi:Fur family ferric uptake transcriptional regulator
MSDKNDFQKLLRDAGLKATPKRLSLLALLTKEHAPRSVAELSKTLGAEVDTVTVYRALEALVEAKIVSRVDFHEREARYEINVGRTHHHHIVCTDCGTIEDIADCVTDTLERKALKSAKQFNIILSHALEFFGVCQKCTIIK